MRSFQPDPYCYFGFRLSCEEREMLYAIAVAHYCSQAEILRTMIQNEYFELTAQGAFGVTDKEATDQ